MKKSSIIIYVTIFLLIVPSSFVVGQDRKNEQKVKIVVKDDSGTKVVLDTLFNGANHPDSLILKDGTVVYLKDPHGKKHLSVSYSGKGNEEGKEIQVSVIRSDSTHNGHGGDVMYYKNTSTNEKHGDHKFTVSTKNSNGSDDKYDISVSDNENDSSAEKTRYVIAKDGMVVTIEGTDETKTKALAKEIEDKLGVSKEKGTNETGKQDSKK